jgi:glycerate 2-kinase
MEPREGVKHKETVMEVLRAALQAVDPYLAVLNALRAQPLIETIPGKIYVIGAGKAVAAMARAAQDVLGERIADGLVLAKDEVERFEGSKVRKLSATNAFLTILPAGHPIPDARGAEGTARILQIADGAQEDDLVLCLISGGGSSLLTSPAEDISLDHPTAAPGRGYHKRAKRRPQAHVAGVGRATGAAGLPRSCAVPHSQ